MTGLRFSARARLDAFAIWDDLAAAGDRWGSLPDDPIDSADAFARRLGDACSRLRVDPECGDACPDLGDGVRSIPVDDAVLYFRATEAMVDVLRVLRNA